jgi:hypothetical protein
MEVKETRTRLSLGTWLAIGGICVGLAGLGFTQVGVMISITSKIHQDVQGLHTDVQALVAKVDTFNGELREVEKDIHMELNYVYQKVGQFEVLVQK